MKRTLKIIIESGTTTCIKDGKWCRYLGQSMKGHACMLFPNPNPVYKESSTQIPLEEDFPGGSLQRCQQCLDAEKDQ